MKPARLVLEAVPRISVAILILPLLLNIGVYYALVARLPALIARGSLDIASYPILVLASLATGFAALASPSPSMFTLTVFFMALADPRLLLSLGPYTLITSLLIVLISDVVRSIYRGSEEAYVGLEHRPRASATGFAALAVALAAAPALFSAIASSYIFAFKLHTQSPYLEPVASFLNSNPAGSIALASIILAAFYAIARYAVDVSIIYALPSPRLASMELSTSASATWIRPSLGFLRGFIASALITPPIYYIARGAVERLGIWGTGGDVAAGIAQGFMGIALFAIVWAIAYRGLFTEEREPSARGIAYMASAAAIIYAVSAGIGHPLIGSTPQGDLDAFLAPIARYYRDLWVMAELLIRAIGGAP